MARVNILIPAYKARFLPRTLASALRQQFAGLSIVVSDDSPGELATAPLRALAYPRPVRFLAGPKRGGMANIAHLLAHLDADCEFVQVLFDDDLLLPGFVQAHVDALDAYPAAACSVSSRWLVDEHENWYGAYPLPEAVRRHPAKVLQVAADFLFHTTVPVAANWLGEYSNALWRRPFAPCLHERSALGVRFSGLEDIGHMLHASLQGPLIYLNEYLGAFRVHGAQATADTGARALKAGHLAWGALAQLGLRAGFVSREQATDCLRIVAQRVRARYAHDAEMMQCVALFEPGTVDDPIAGFDRAWQAYLSQPLENFAAEPADAAAQASPIPVAA
jgi:hypothetical protein